MAPAETVLSGMRPTGSLHLGHLRGVLHNWKDLQREYRCYYMVADWHALTTDYAQPGGMIGPAVEEMVLCWLAAGIDPERSALFVQSQVPEHAELHLMLSMLCPLPWLERMPTYRDQQQQLKDRDLNTYGFLGYPLLQAADILAYRANVVPVGEDQVPHIEFSRDLAVRFNNLYGGEPGCGSLFDGGREKLGAEACRRLEDLARAYRETGGEGNLHKCMAIIEACAGLSAEERSALEAAVRGTRTPVLPEPRAMLAPAPKVIGLDGRKMSKSYGNTIDLLEDGKEIERKFLRMPTDPARKRRSNPGDPDKCPVWSFHKMYSDGERQEEVRKGCTTAGIGCIDCKRMVLENMGEELDGVRAKAAMLKSEGSVYDILDEGNRKARAAAGETMAAVRRAVGLPQ